MRVRATAPAAFDPEVGRGCRGPSARAPTSHGGVAGEPSVPAPSHSGCRSSGGIPRPTRIPGPARRPMFPHIGRRRRPDVHAGCVFPHSGRLHAEKGQHDSAPATTTPLAVDVNQARDITSPPTGGAGWSIARDRVMHGNNATSARPLLRSARPLIRRVRDRSRARSLGGRAGVDGTTPTRLTDQVGLAALDGVVGTRWLLSIPEHHESHVQ